MPNPLEQLLAMAASPSQATKPASSFVNRLAEYQALVDMMGSENAGSQVDARRTGLTKQALPSLKDEELSQFDRYVHGVNLEKQNPGAFGLFKRALMMPLVSGYEAAKLAPPVLNAAARIPGLETLAVDETTSPPSLQNIIALSSGAFGDVGRAVHHLLNRK